MTAPAGSPTARPRSPQVPAPPAGRARRAPRSLVVDAAGALSGLGLGAVIGMAITAESRGALAAPGGWATFAGRLSGLLGAYLMLLMVLLMARIPLLERAAGQDRLTGWHRAIGGWPIVLIAFHGFFVTLGYAESSRTGFWAQALTLVRSYPEVLAAVVAFGLLLLAGVSSWRAARRRMRYESWWVIHLYVYLGLGLAFAHQIRTGASFVGHPLTQLVWSVAWGGAAGAVVCFRIGLPLWRSLRHGLRVVAVTPESGGAVSVVLAGRHLERLRVEGGQYFQWRFLRRGLWWQAHPYSLSALPVPPYLRITAGVRGDIGPSLLALAPGTRVALEGPYGTFTAARGDTARVLLVGAGLGVTPIRAILEQLPAGTDVAVMVRASRRDELVLQRELTALVHARGGAVHEVLGPRDTVRFDQRVLRRLVPDVAERDVYVCGPDGFSDKLVAAARRLGVPAERIHRERFTF
jgi:predicted ferric reductase